MIWWCGQTWQSATLCRHLLMLQAVAIAERRDFSPVICYGLPHEFATCGGGRRWGGWFLCGNHLRASRAGRRGHLARKGTAVPVQGAHFGRRALQRHPCLFSSAGIGGPLSARRSEEHTSELQ